MKACTGHFKPIKQWFYFDAVECLPAPWCKRESGAILPKEDLCATSHRYEGQTKIFGKRFQDKLGDLKYFIVS